MFGSLHCHVTIGSVGKGIADSALDKSKVVFSLRDNCRGVQHLAAEDKDDWEADSGFPQRENGSDLSVTCTLQIDSGTAKVFWLSGSEEPVILIETNGTYNETITLPSGGNYIGI